MTRRRQAGFGEAAAARPGGFGATSGRARVLAAVAALVLGGTSRVFACPVCFGAEETSMIEGTRLGIFVLLGVTLAVQAAFAGFFLYLRQRAKRMGEIELDTEWSDLQRGASRAS